MRDGRSMISVVIPSYNSAETIEPCLASLSHQSYSGDYEIILADSSCDNTRQIVREKFPDVRLISFALRTDPGKARNAGILEAKGDVLALIDSDCIAAQDWLEKIEAAHRSRYKAVGGVVYNGNHPRDLVGLAGYLAEFREFLPEQPRQETWHIPTCNISYKREIFAEKGLFDGKYYPQEDLVFNHRLCADGERILLDPAIRVYHRHRSNLRDFLAHQRRIGEVTARVLPVARLAGAAIVKNPLLSMLALPVLPVVKFIKTVAVFHGLKNGSISKNPKVLGIFALGLMYWAVGFGQGVCRAQRVERQQKEAL